MTNQSEVICPYCNQVYQFEKLYGDTNTTCPYCNNEFIVSDEDKIVYTETSTEHQQRTLHDYLTFKQYQKHLLILVTACFIFGFLLVYSYINPNEILKEIEIEVPIYIEPEPESVFMEGVGYEFNDKREPTNNELFQMEESLSLCHNPTYNEVSTFIEIDDLDDYLHDDWFDCDEYSFSLIDAARNKKMRAGFVILYQTADEYDDTIAHAIVVFNTTDKGLIFVEPQLDDIFTYKEFEKMKKKNRYYAEDDSYIDYLYSIEMDFDHYTIDWWYWYFGMELMQSWNLYKSEYPNFKSSYDEYFVYE